MASAAALVCWMESSAVFVGGSTAKPATFGGVITDASSIGDDVSRSGAAGAAGGITSSEPNNDCVCLLD